MVICSLPLACLPFLGLFPRGESPFRLLPAVAGGDEAAFELAAAACRADDLVPGIVDEYLILINDVAPREGAREI